MCISIFRFLIMEWIIWLKFRNFVIIAMGKIFCIERDFLPWNHSVYRQAQITDLLSSHLNIRWLLRRNFLSPISLLPRLNTDMPLYRVKTCGIYYGPFLPQELVSQMASHSSKETHWIYFPKPSPRLGKWHLHSISCLNQILKTSDWSQTLHIQSMSNSCQLKHFRSLKISQVSLPLYSLQSLCFHPCPSIMSFSLGSKMDPIGT